jgi:hypothetical protein
MQKEEEGSLGKYAVKNIKGGTGRGRRRTQASESVANKPDPSEVHT